MAKKQVIRLTESDLHRIIKESVNNILTELDWRTYASAADKRRKQAYDERESEIKRSGLYWNDKAEELYNKSRKLDDAAGKRMSKDYGMNISTHGIHGDRHVIDNDAEWTIGTNAEGPKPLGYHYLSSPDKDWRKDWYDHTMDDYYKYGYMPTPDDDRWPHEKDEDYQKRLRNNKIGRDVDDFVHGRMQYQKGKGWSKK